MPSCISHMYISRYLPIDSSFPFFNKFQFYQRVFQIGSIAPDLPYASIGDNDPFENETILSKLFHFTDKDQTVDISPNKLPLIALNKIKEYIVNGNKIRDIDAFFWFIMGYISHVVADGICHPYVMDKTGKYEDSKKADHRALELGIDVFLLKHFSEFTGKPIDVVNSGIDSYIKGFLDLKCSRFIVDNFSELISEIYHFDARPNEIEGWISGIIRFYWITTGQFAKYLRKMKFTSSFLFRSIEELEGRDKEFLVLEKPKYWDYNFLKTDKIDFVNKCIPQYNKLMLLILKKSYDYIYNSGSEITSDDLPAFSLDSGRIVTDPYNLDLKPVLWEL